MCKLIFIINKFCLFFFYSQQFTVAHRKKQGVLQHPQHPLFPCPCFHTKGSCPISQIWLNNYNTSVLSITPLLSTGGRYIVTTYSYISIGTTIKKVLFSTSLPSLSKHSRLVKSRDVSVAAPDWLLCVHLNSWILAAAFRWVLMDWAQLKLV